MIAQPEVNPLKHELVVAQMSWELIFSGAEEGHHLPGAELQKHRLARNIFQRNELRHLPWRESAEQPSYRDW